MQRRMLPRVLVVTSFEFCLAVMLYSGEAASQSFRIEGAVRDSSGAAVVGAKVDLRAASTSASRITDSSGNFSFDSVPQSSGSVSVQARGFVTVQQNWNAGTGESLHLEIVLSPAAATEQIVVTAARIETRLSDVAGSAVALSSEDLNSTPALLVDDKLRQIPGFTLFRRSDSRTANPTSQGASLNA